jgi:hypothetical protein
LGYESLQVKVYNEPHYDCGRPNRRRSHNRASNMAFAERQDARPSNYRQSTRLKRAEVDRDSPRHIDDAERPRCDANDYFAVGTVPLRRIFLTEPQHRAIALFKLRPDHTAVLRLPQLCRGHFLPSDNREGRVRSLVPNRHLQRTHPCDARRRAAHRLHRTHSEIRCWAGCCPCAKGDSSTRAVTRTARSAVPVELGMSRNNHTNATRGPTNDRRAAQGNSTAFPAVAPSERPIFAAHRSKHSGVVFPQARIAGHLWPACCIPPVSRSSAWTIGRCIAAPSSEALILTLASSICGDRRSSTACEKFAKTSR